MAGLGSYGQPDKTSAAMVLSSMSAMKTEYPAGTWVPLGTLCAALAEVRAL
jgi:hypothetical protein